MEHERYLELLAKEFPNRYAALIEIINLQAILNLPKGTEHFISDVHGEYEAFCHILNNVSGVIRDKVTDLFRQELTPDEISTLCTLIYYPLEFLKNNPIGSDEYRRLITYLVRLATFLSSKYTRSKVRKAIPKEFAYIIDELMHAKMDEDNNRIHYHEEILKSIISTGSGDYFLEALCSLIKRLAVDRLHVVGDLFDRGPHPDLVVDLLMKYHNIDLQWGNHDVLWLGAACGSAICAATVTRNNVHYNNYELLENGYGISMRPLALFAEKTYEGRDLGDKIYKAISVIALKLERDVVERNPDFSMHGRLLFNYIDYEKGTLTLNGKQYDIDLSMLPTVDPKDPYRLTEEEQEVAEWLRNSFLHSKRIQEHADFLVTNGAMYKVCNGNLLFHGCVPLNDDGTFARVLCDGRYRHGKAYLDYCDARVRESYNNRSLRGGDFLWWLWCGSKSPLSGRVIKTFERTFIKDKSAWEEPRDPYYVHYFNEDVCRTILIEFGLDPDRGHIINGHTPIKVKDGEKPVRAGGRLLVIDGGFCRAYQKTTGIAGYTLIYNSHNLRLKAHYPFKSISAALTEHSDILSDTELVETFSKRRMVADTDDGVEIRSLIDDLNALLEAFKSGRIVERNVDSLV
ncbi:MAG: fructose-1,6-bisphosphatase [Succinivibrio sp.]|nr:fructose-1,6-bisphosphatase [Succinivibrio sp.]